MITRLSFIIASEFFLLLLILALPSTAAASLVTKVAVKQVETKPERLMPAVWKTAAKNIAKKVGKAVKEFVIYEVAKKTYDHVSKWAKRHFKR
ncbi:hypothetical protein ECG_00001 [Echinococcus granulosus]|uniref:SCP domain-containing protein n=1 Tax=Echinococcus granulosus TaxID=6210 RepID=A0A068X4N5_ECHGR|nr:hypothetical protein ECG_00001 [Echinococcus granulosus]CDS24861.1 hypothetical protein EgrG_001201900 [Echinococcus granulosus]